MAFSEEYFIHLEGEQKGPYTFPQLKRLYDNNLIPEETLYWCDGMEQLQPVSELCGAQRRSRMRRLRQLRLVGGIVVLGVALVTAYCAPVLRQGWREMNDRDENEEGAYWRARGFVREELKEEDESVAFRSYRAASVTLSGSDATVILPSTLFEKDGSRQEKTWKVQLRYDASGREWRLGGH